MSVSWTQGCLLAFLLLAVGAQSSERDGSYEEQLMLKLENQTHPLVRPVKYTNQTVNVWMYLSLRDYFVDEQAGTFRVYAAMYVSWKDYNLNWNLAEYGNIYYIPIHKAKIWRPNVELMNQAKPIKRHSNYSWLSKDGRVGNYDRFWFTVMCHMDFTYFPFDGQTCYMNFTTSLYNDNEVRFQPARWVSTWYTRRRGRQYNPFTLVSARAKSIRADAHNPSEKGKGLKNTIWKISFVLKRKPAYYLYVYVMPVVLVSLLTVVCFLLPPGDPQKSTLGGCLLVCFAIFFLEINAFLPAFHASVPIIGKYYMAMYTMLALSILIGTIITNLTKRSEGVCKPPDLFKQISIDYIGKCVCLPYNPVEYRRKIEAGIANINLEGVTTATTPTTTSADASKSAELDVISDWLHISAIFDRLLCVVFLVLTIIITSAILTNHP